jgi:hypothetical protein
MGLVGHMCVTVSELSFPVSLPSHTYCISLLRTWLKAEKTAQYLHDFALPGGSMSQFSAASEII